jgi:hypothetical protein
MDFALFRTPPVGLGAGCAGMGAVSPTFTIRTFSDISLVQNE